jgi:glycosyltransferase involved in cell wall biosynthesis
MRVLIVSAWDAKSGVLSVYRALAKHLAPSVRYSAYAFDGWREDTWWTFCDELIDGRSVTLTGVLTSGKYDLLHCVDTTYSPPYGVETWVKRARFSGPVVLMAQLARRVLTEGAHATRYVACSQDAAEVLSQDADGHVRVITNGYDEDVFYPGPAPHSYRPLLVWVGRSFDPQKDVELFLDTVEALPGHDAVLIDTDPSAAAVMTRLARLGHRVTHRALLTSREMAEIYRTAAASSGAFISTSRWEGFNIAAVEAMACGCPVVAPRIPGHGHFVDGSTAFVYDRSGGASAVVEAIGRLRDTALRGQLVANARQKARAHWTSRGMADAYLQLYEEALSECPRPLSLTLSDRAARTAWRAAIAGRPVWHQARRLVRA